MKTPVKIGLALVVGALCIAGIYQFRQSRITPGRLDDMRKMEERIADLNIPEEPGYPEVFRVEFECSNGDFVAEFYREWSPAGTKRIWDLVNAGFYDETRFFRVIEGFVAQFGVSGTPAIQAEWESKTLGIEEVRASNLPGTITFAMGTTMPDSNVTDQTRATQLFINLKDNHSLDDNGFAPVGRVVEGMDVVKGFYAGYGEQVQQVQQDQLTANGNAYLNTQFPMLDYIKKATVIEAPPGAAPPSASDTATTPEADAAPQEAPALPEPAAAP